MARTQGPLLSQSAAGSVAGIITHSTWKGRSYARQTVIPNDPKSGKQIGNRAIMTFLAHAWGSSMSDADHAAWQPTGDPDASNNFNLYLTYNLNRWHQNKAPSKRPDAIEAGADPLWNTTPNAQPFPRSLEWRNKKPAVLNDAWGVFCSIQAIVGPQLFSEVLFVEPAVVNVLTQLTTRHLTPGSYHTSTQAFSDTGKKLTLRNFTRTVPA